MKTHPHRSVAAALLLAAAVCAWCQTPDAASMKGVVTFAGDGVLVVSRSDRLDAAGTLVRIGEGASRPAGPERFRVGDWVNLTGVWRGEGAAREIVAGKVVKTGHSVLEEPELPKAADFRKGLLHMRRVRLEGELRSISREDTAGGVKTYLGVNYPKKQLQSVCVHADIAHLGLEKRDIVSATGVVRNTFDADGNVIGAELEVAGADDIRRVVPATGQGWRIAAIALAAATGVLVVAIGVAWRRARAERLKQSIIAEERSRLATELHDTLEQHFAGAKILIAGALRMKDLPPGAAALLRQAADVMAAAKLETRDAVMDLQSDSAMRLSPADAIRAQAKQVTASGAANVRVRLDALPERLGAGVRHDLVSIVREAVTNAIKHGKAKNIAIVADKAQPADGKGGAASAAHDLSVEVQVLNDGEPFDPAKALGPEYGHFGLAGMRRRAERSKIALSFVSTGRWCGIKLGIA